MEPGLRIPKSSMGYRLHWKLHFILTHLSEVDAKNWVHELLRPEYKQQACSVLLCFKSCKQSVWRHHSDVGKAKYVTLFLMHGSRLSKELQASNRKSWKLENKPYSSSKRDVLVIDFIEYFPVKTHPCNVIKEGFPVKFHFNGNRCFEDV